MLVAGSLDVDTTSQLFSPTVSFWGTLLPNASISFAPVVGASSSETWPVKLGLGSATNAEIKYKGKSLT